jgi:acetyl-CoA/propionyl-CoA carboxylase biotin carboxyl carrier protein
VEHPITELVTGLDLVEWQLRIASGEALDFAQDDVRHHGHAIEVRINAEDSSGGRFAPSPGTLTRFDQPAGPGVRLDAGYAVGDTVSQYYDNLIAKLIVWAPNRERARRRLLRAIDETVIEGVATTLPADIVILTDDAFIGGTHSTTWVETDLDFSAIAAPISPTPRDESPLQRKDVTAEVNGRRVAVSVWLSAEDTAPASSALSARTRRRHHTPIAVSGSGTVTAPMQGTIVKVSVEVGQSVEVGDTIVILVAMKMENSVRAERAGRVRTINVTAGDGVSVGDVVAEIE